MSLFINENGKLETGIELTVYDLKESFTLMSCEATRTTKELIELVNALDEPKKSNT